MPEKNGGYRIDDMRAMLARIDREAAADKEAAALVERFNAALSEQREPQFSPTIGAALRAGKPFLRVHCPGCRQVADVDLRTIVRPRDFPITALRAAMRCESMCRGQGPRVEIVGLVSLPYDPRKITWRDRA
jgi:hypothetical protein